MTVRPTRTVRSELHVVTTIDVDGQVFPWHELESVDSTMDYAADLIRGGCQPWTVVSSRRQTSGRGTRGRTWHAPESKGLWVSVVLPTPPCAGNLDTVSVLAARSLVEAFGKFTDRVFGIKPPNDVTIDGRKIAGILLESVSCGSTVGSVILGMGVNLSQSAGDFLKAGLPDATSLWLETGRDIESVRLLRAFLRRFKPEYERTVLKRET